MKEQFYTYKYEQFFADVRSTKDVLKLIDNN